MSNTMKGFKMHSTSKLCLTVLLGLLTLAGTVSAEDFEVTEIVEIGPIRVSVGEGTMKFSPSGDELASFLGTTLILTNIEDGTKREVITLDMRPLQFEWQSEGEIVVLEYKSLGGPNDYRRLTRIDINTGQTLTLHEHYRDKNPSTPETEPILSLKKTIKGQFFYKLMPVENIVRRGRVRTDQGAVAIIPPSNYIKTELNKSLTSDYYLEWDQDREGLFKISMDNNDSTQIGPYFAVSHLFPPVYSNDLSYIMASNKILRVEDSSFIYLEPMFEVPEDMDGCSFFRSEFNPKVPEELLFQRECCRVTNEREVYRYFIGIFNINSNEIIVFDELAGMKECFNPVYSPDGLSIAFVSDRIVYLMRREWK